MEATKIAKLEKQLLYTGLGDILSDQLKSKINEGQSEFSIPLNKKIGDDDVTVEAKFRKGKEDYFFNSYQVNVAAENGIPVTMNVKVMTPDPIHLAENKKEWINSTITLKEAYNLTQGRSVYQDFVKVDKEVPENNRKYYAWQVLDFKNPNEDGSYPLTRVYNFDLPSLLEQYPIKELTNEKYKAELLDSLKRGNLQNVTFLNPDGSEEKMKIEANAAHRSINIYDAQMNRVSLNKKAQQVPTQQQSSQDVSSPAKNNSQKEKPADESDSGPRKVNREKKKGIKAA